MLIILEFNFISILIVAIYVVIFFINYSYRDSNSDSDSGPQHRESDADKVGYNQSVVDLIAMIMKVDGEATKSELMVVKSYFASNYSYVVADRMLKSLQEALKSDGGRDVDIMMRDIKMNLPYNKRFILFQTLYKMAAADGYICDEEVSLIDRFATLACLRESETARFREYYTNIKREQDRMRGHQSKTEDASSNGKSSSSNDSLSHKWAFDALNLPIDATLQEVKNAFRKLSMKYHPDRMSDATEEERKSAVDYFLKVSDAYHHLIEAPIWDANGVQVNTCKNNAETGIEVEMLNWAYEILGLSTKATPSQIQNAYNKLRVNLRSTAGDSDSTYKYKAQRLAELEKAYSILSKINER